MSGNEQNRGLSEIAQMASRIEAELLAVLTPQEQKSFHLEQALRMINTIFERAT